MNIIDSALQTIYLRSIFVVSDRTTDALYIDTTPPSSSFLPFCYVV